MSSTKNTQEPDKKDLSKDYKNKPLQRSILILIFLQNCLNFWVQKQQSASSLAVPFMTKKLR